MLGGFAAAALTGQQAAAQKRPNMVVILADDCSWYDIGCYGAVNNRTPHIDSLARAGMRFTNAWNSVSTSVPTRHCLYTGMYPIRNGGHYNLSAIREGVETMPVRLARLGYRVGLAGKWHIHPKEAFPFERVPGFAVNCLTKDPSHTMKGVEEFISRDREEPFCLVVASVNPHVPWTGGDPSKFDLGKLVLPPHFVDTPQTRKSYAAYLAEIDLLDREVGDVVRVLRERELLDDTLVIFLSEQGTHSSAEEMDARAGRSGYRSRYGTKQTGEPPRTKNRSAMKRIILTAVCGATAVLTACTAGAPSVETAPFGRLSSGEEVTLYRLRSGNGASMEVIDYGCRVVRICVPDRNGVIADIVPGYDDIRDFETGSERFFGALIGRYGNRIANASFPLDGDTVRLTANECLAGCPGHLHGGTKGFDRVMWQAEPLVEADRAGVRFTRLSPDGEEGYPGNLACTVTYWFTKDNVWRAEYEATTDRPTIVNLSNHTYFNLKGVDDGGYVMDHVMQVEADRYLPNDARFVPLGPSEPVEGTPFDLREPHRVDYAIDTPNEHLRTMRGFSVCWMLHSQTGELARAADLWEPRSGRGIELWTTEPGLLTYTGRLFSPKVVGKGGRAVEKFGGMLLETLRYPDSPNHPEYPSAVLRPGETYHSTTEFRFYAR